MPALPLQTTLIEFGSYLNSVSADINTLTVKVLDSNGRIVEKLSTSVTQGVQILKAKMSGLSAGTYVLTPLAELVF